MKDTITLAREARLFDDDQEPLPEYLDRFRALIIEDLASGAGEPAHYRLWNEHNKMWFYRDFADEPECEPIYTATQLAAAVAQASKRGAPCERHCEANAFRIELRQKDKRIAELETKINTASVMTNAVCVAAQERVSALESQLAAARKPLTEEVVELLKFALEAVSLLGVIRCHPRRHDMERSWLTEADKVIGYWDKERTRERIARVIEAAHGIGEQK